MFPTVHPCCHCGSGTELFFFMPCRIDGNSNKHCIALLSSNFCLLMNFFNNAIMPSAWIGCQNIVDFELPALLPCPRKCLVDMPKPVVGHVNFEFPLTSLVSNAHQHLPAFNRAKEQTISDLPRHDHAIDGAANFQVCFFVLVQPLLLFKAFDFTPQLRSTASHAIFFITREPFVFE